MALVSRKTAALSPAATVCSHGLNFLFVFKASKGERKASAKSAPKHVVDKMLLLWRLTRTWRSPHACLL